MNPYAIAGASISRLGLLMLAVDLWHDRGAWRDWLGMEVAG